MISYYIRKTFQTFGSHNGPIFRPFERRSKPSGTARLSALQGGTYGGMWNTPIPIIYTLKPEENLAKKKLTRGHYGKEVIIRRLALEKKRAVTKIPILFLPRCPLTVSSSRPRKNVYHTFLIRNPAKARANSMMPTPICIYKEKQHCIRLLYRWKFIQIKRHTTRSNNKHNNLTSVLSGGIIYMRCLQCLSRL